MKSELSQGYKVTPLGIIPKEWEIYDFDKIVMRPQSRHLPNPQIHLRCIELEHLSQGGGSILGYIDSAEQKSMKNEFDEGDVLFGKLRPYLRKYWLAKFGGVCSTEIWVFRVMSDICTKEYLFNIVSSYNFIQKANVSSGSKMPRAEWDFVSKIPILTPPLSEQEKIAEILSTWDKAIEKQIQLIQKLELRKKGLMQQLLTGKKRLPGFTGEWKKVKLSLLIDKISNGYTYDVNSGGNIPITRIETISKGFIDYMRVGYTQYVDTLENYRLLKGDILFSHINSIIHIGKVAIYKGEKELYHGMNLLLIRAKQTMNKNYLYYFLSSSIARKKVRSFAKQAVNQASVNTEELKKWILNIPSLQEQTAIANILSSCDEEIRLAQDKLAAIKEQKKGLMQVLLTGKKRVKI